MNGSDLLRYARVHRAGAIVVGLSVVAVLSALFGGTRISLPSIGSASLSSGVPYRQELPLLSAVFLTAAFGGSMTAHEASGAFVSHRLHRAYFVALTLVACAISFGTESLAVGAEHGVVFVRSILIWLGLALLSVRLFGEQLGWVIPMASAFLLIWYPLNWWDWTANPASDPFSWCAAAVSLALGAAATAATPWRRRAFLRKRG
ncbi:hypothetical protein ACFV6U_33520 [Streptomyces sp. NPDC059810]|uniref:hypothetical protein n=1 Tax=Streptomyces sp. NPDC059810 TaxID=3346956 RepID=UPI00364F3DEF